MDNNVEIRVEMICECGNTTELESGSCSSISSKGAIVLYEHAVYICAKCGATMSRRVVKTTKTETETIL